MTRRLQGHDVKRRPSLAPAPPMPDLARRRCAARSTQPDATVLALPYADPDVVAVVRSGFADATAAIGLATATDAPSCPHPGLIGPATALRLAAWRLRGPADGRRPDRKRRHHPDAGRQSRAAACVTAGATPPPAHTTITTNDSQVDTGARRLDPERRRRRGPGQPQRLRGVVAAVPRRDADDQPRAAELRPRSVVVAPGHRWDPTPSYAAQVLADTGTGAMDPAGQPRLRCRISPSDREHHP